MAIWQARFISFDGEANYKANLTLEDQGDGRATGTLRHFDGPNPIEEIDLTGVVHNNHFTVKGSSTTVEVDLELSFTPFVFALTGGSKFLDLETKQALYLFVITQGVE
ncbi:MAG TPA: hypothetical protein VLB76_06415 [Thermoanaerobaculia bacterium]|jgi:hypothetical protein|nr:hypothetical protein [Thermoanaerobaculia bacterium]